MGVLCPTNKAKVDVLCRGNNNTPKGVPNRNSYNWRLTQTSSKLFTRHSTMDCAHTDWVKAATAVISKGCVAT